MTTYFIKQSDYDKATSSAKGEYKPYRLSDNSVEGATETIESDVIIPETRIPSIPEVGTESSSGSTESEWNIDEQDDFIASAMCSEWVEDTEKEIDNVTEYKTLTLGTKKEVWRMMKKYAQAPAEWREFTGLQVNQMTITMALNSFVKLSFDWLGGNNPVSVAVDPVDSTKFDYAKAMTTKAYKTLEGSIKMGDSFDSLIAVRQCPNFDLTVNNNKETTQALFEMEAIEMSDGDFDVSGNIEIWKADAIGMTLFNESVKGADKAIEVSVTRTVGGVKTTYTIQLMAHLQSPSESKDGNKYKVAVAYTVNVDNGIKFIKQVENVN